jgi:ABC-type arginine/histidine transport system permease subunit
MESVQHNQSIDGFTKFALFFRANRAYYSITIGGTALLLQLFLFYLIVYKSPPPFKVFKKLVFLNNLISFVFNLFCIVLQPVSSNFYLNILNLF